MEVLFLDMLSKVFKNEVWKLQLYFAGHSVTYCTVIPFSIYLQTRKIIIFQNSKMLDVRDSKLR